MADQSNGKFSVRLPFASACGHATIFYLVSISPIIPLSLFAFWNRPMEQGVRVVILVLTGVLVILSLCIFTGFLMKFLHPMTIAVRDLEIQSTGAEFVDSFSGMLASLSRTNSSIRTWEEHQYQLEILQKHANLKAFQSQISPHFLYNMLDTIRGQALEDGSVIVSDMIEALSLMMRYSISNSDSMVTLGVELKNIDNYIKIQQFRFGNRFKYTEHLDGLDNGLIEINIPKMTLQPIVENALVHGIESMLSGGEITLTVFNTQSRLVIQIADNGIGMDDKQLIQVRKNLQGLNDGANTGITNEKNTGIALTNVDTRLKLVFGNQYGLSIFSTLNAGTMVEITVPSSAKNGDGI